MASSFSRNTFLRAALLALMLMPAACMATSTSDDEDEEELEALEELQEEEVGEAASAVAIDPGYVAVLDTAIVEVDGKPLLVQYDEVSTTTLKLARKGEPFEVWMRFDYETPDTSWTSQSGSIPLKDATWIGESGYGTSYVVAFLVPEIKPAYDGGVASWAQIIGPNLPPPGIIGPDIIGPNQPGIIGPNKP